MTNGNETILQMKDISKAFDSNLALDKVNFALGANEIHGLLGGNGAGKTTLMNVLYGLYREDSGDILLHDKKMDIRSPKDALQNGIGMVHQHFLQINNFPVIQNVVLGTNIKNKLTLNLELETKKVKSLCQRFGIDVDPHTLIEDLPMGMRQKVEILKALYRGVEVLILDEPTTNLTPQEVDDLFESLSVMVAEGLSIVFITHKLREVMSVCHRITILRNGQNVTTLDHSEASEEICVRAMVGEGMDVQKSIIFSKGSLGPASIKVGEGVMVDVTNLNLAGAEGVPPLLKDINFKVHESEIFGVAGVAGNGQSELAECMVGVRPATDGRIMIDDKPSSMNTGDLLANGVTYIPEDRLEDGYLPKANIAQNLILGSQRLEPYSKHGFINWKTVFEVSWKLIKEYNIKTSGPTDLAGNLSGGNIQRVMIARAFAQPTCKLLVAHCPTRGLDLPSMDFVYEKMLERKQQGTAILLLSEDLDELLLLCDRIGVMYRGEMVGILTRDKFEKYEIGRLMSGIKSIA
jgi:general nucleoside transport system ATP-binding protein